MPGDLIIDLVRHMKARNAKHWTEDDADRPLSKLGQRQADFHATAMKQGDAVAAVYTSPALRCRQTVEPLAKAVGVDVHVEPLLAATGLFASLPIGAENPLLSSLRDAHPEGGRVVACSHGDTIPAFIASLATEPYVSSGAVLKGFGGWYRVTVAGGDIRIERFQPPDGFPLD